MTGDILQIKKGKVCNIKFDENNLIETAIKKEPVNEVIIEKLGIIGDDVGLKQHHGGIDKSIFFVSTYTFEELNKITNSFFEWDKTAIYGENFVVTEFNENNVCVGDIIKMGECTIEISQPRKPCVRLSLNTKNENMREIIFKSGLTGWYARVLQGGKVNKNDKIKLLERNYPKLTIRELNKLLSDFNPNLELLREALNCEKLAEAFKKTLRLKLENSYEK